MHSVRLFHTCNKWLYRAIHLCIIHTADAEIIILESRCACLGKLRHAGTWPAKHDPLCVLDAPFEMDWLLIIRANDFHLRLSHARHFIGIVRATQANIRLHLGHSVQVAFRPRLDAFERCVFLQGSQDTSGAHFDMRISACLLRGFDKSDDHLFGNVEGFDQNVFASFQLAGMIDNGRGEDLESWIVHSVMRD